MRAPSLLALLLFGGILAGCTSPAADEPLTRGDLAVAPASERPQWPPLESATIRPGLRVTTEKGDCPTNFMFIRPDNTSLFLGTTAYCTRELPVGSIVAVGAPENIGIVVYNSWHTMHERGETDEEAWQYNDFAVIKVDESARRRAHPALLGLGGPTGLLDGAAVAVGERVRAYENLSAADVARIDWADGVVTGRAGDWALLAHMAPPTIPGAQGGGVVDAQGRALGIVVNLGVAPNPGATGVARLDTVMAYAHQHAKLDMRLMTWGLLEAGGPVGDASTAPPMS